ncbi:hypothetical protein [Marinigracilibium pacificum]|uniref:Uncharacterized protein n=1 Tax=Marinigracilibium pacificum TaxID=2729599 RepID=A0A848J1N8_9BACT|nr:hypothetical protein [Marinigracilibium pacificum]NMM50477.1 hypothetical protein [Marinigracilibium pacificum]
MANDIEKALAKASSWVDNIDGVEGVAQGLKNGKDCITVFISNDEVQSKLPKELDGYAIVVENTGQFMAEDGIE